MLKTIHYSHYSITVHIVTTQSIGLYFTCSATLTGCDRPILSLQVTESSKTSCPTNDAIPTNDSRDASGDAMQTESVNPKTDTDEIWPVSSVAVDDDMGRDRHLDLMTNHLPPVPDVTAHMVDLNEPSESSGKIVKDLKDAFGSSACFVFMTKDPEIDSLTH